MTSFCRQHSLNGEYGEWGGPLECRNTHSVANVYYWISGNLSIKYASFTVSMLFCQYILIQKYNILPLMASGLPIRLSVPLFGNIYPFYLCVNIFGLNFTIFAIK